MRGRLIVFVAWIAGCGGANETDEGPGACEPPHRVVGERCLAPGMADDGCEAGTIADGNGGCRAAGIMANECGEGFVHDGDVGCTPVLPAASCPFGTMATPGEDACRAVMTCGAGKWGDIPVDASTRYVDGSYPGSDSDGSATRPFVTIADALAGAPAAAIIALAEGSYVEDVLITGRPLRFWGVCPERVAIVATGAELAALDIRTGASGSEVHGIALRGPAAGLVVTGATDVLLDRIWIHDTASRGANVQGTLGPTSARMVGSLVEQTREMGVAIIGTEGSVEDTVVRATQPRPDNLAGIGVAVHVECTPAEGCDPSASASGVITRSLVEHSHEQGIYVVGSYAEIEATVVRDTWPSAYDMSFGRGIAVQPPCDDLSCTTMPASAAVRRSLVERSHDVGIFVMGAEADVEATVVRSTQSIPSDPFGGSGITVQLVCAETCDANTTATATVRNALLEYHQLAGLVVGGGATVDAVSTVVRSSLPNPTTLLGGRGIAVQQCRAEEGCGAGVPARATIVGCRVQQQHEFGLSIVGASALVESTLVDATEPRALDGIFGDGVAVFALELPASAEIHHSRVSNSVRAGVSSFGSPIAMNTTAVVCAPVPLAGDPIDGHAFSFEDGGGNGCGCASPTEACKAVSPGLQPPEPLPH